MSEGPTFHRLAAVPIAAAVGATLLAVLSPSLQHHWLDPWSASYQILGVLPTVLLGALALWIALQFPQMNARFREFPMLANLLAASVLSATYYWVYRFPSGRRQLAVFALATIVALLWLGLLLGRRGPLVSATMVALLVVFVGVFEVMDDENRPVVWGEGSTMARTFPRDAPFIGPGGRLNPNLANWMVRSGVEDAKRVWIRTNSLGFRNDEELELAPFQNRLQNRLQNRPMVLSLGDSFSNGFGISQNQFYGALLQVRLRSSSDPQTLVLNAEVSDPCYGLHFLETYGLGYKPDLIVLNLSANDALQSFWGCSQYGVFRLAEEGRLLIRENLDRRSVNHHTRLAHLRYPARGDGAIEQQAGLRSNGILRLGSLARLRSVDRLRVAYQRRMPEVDDAKRSGELTASAADGLQADGFKILFDGFPNLGMAYQEDLPPKRQSLDMLFDLLAAMNRGASSVGADFLVVYFPQRHQVQQQDWEVLRRRWHLDPADFEVDSEPDRIGEFCASRGIEFLDLTEAFRPAAFHRNLYLPHDGHPNEAGHALAARQAAEHILERFYLRRVKVAKGVPTP